MGDCEWVEKQRGLEAKEGSGERIEKQEGPRGRGGQRRKDREARGA
jgi:hypothetical protein